MKPNRRVAGTGRLGVSGGGAEVMAERVLLHIGAPKAGTTFLQTILWKNRESLGAQGLLVPGSAGSTSTWRRVR